jgi:hypothetical protein
MYKLTVAVLVAVLALNLVVVPAMASHTPGATGCEMAHECFSDVAKWFPPGTPENTLSIVVWDPQSGGYAGIGAYGLAALCYNYGGYYYLDYGGEYWNAC